MEEKQPGPEWDEVEAVVLPYIPSICMSWMHSSTQQRKIQIKMEIISPNKDDACYAYNDDYFQFSRGSMPPKMEEESLDTSSSCRSRKTNEDKRRGGSEERSPSLGYAYACLCACAHPHYARPSMSSAAKVCASC
ncbi:hypothetical protein CRG98_044408 [Punica granatum]|uniref:Uncharacterized protein n=1 Tax=Punica granatum TaxID=22663 RepID=A0A2I0HU65_PUNGR|nr:hypothetical protein CRG98_044408 [Punica granatum]